VRPCYARPTGGDGGRSDLVRGCKRDGRAHANDKLVPGVSGAACRRYPWRRRSTEGWAEALRSFGASMWGAPTIPLSIAPCACCGRCISGNRQQGILAHSIGRLLDQRCPGLPAQLRLMDRNAQSVGVLGQSAPQHQVRRKCIRVYTWEGCLDLSDAAPRRAGCFQQRDDE
jgi:hypothetical protein